MSPELAGWLLAFLVLLFIFILPAPPIVYRKTNKNRGCEESVLVPPWNHLDSFERMNVYRAIKGGSCPSRELLRSFVQEPGWMSVEMKDAISARLMECDGCMAHWESLLDVHSPHKEYADRM